MKKPYEHPGEIVQEWRIGRGWNPRKLGDLVGTSRQNIENLESGIVRNPHYLPELARVMGYASSDDLRDLKPPPNGGPSPEGDAQPLTQQGHKLVVQPWERVMNRSVLPVWDAARWVYVPDDALAPSFSRGDAVELIPIQPAEDLQVGDVVVVEDEPGNRWLRIFALDVNGARWARTLRPDKQVFVEFELPPRGWPKVIARLERHAQKRRGI